MEDTCLPYLQTTVPRACLFVWGPEAYGLNFEKSDMEKEKRAVESTCPPVELLKMDFPSA